MCLVGINNFVEISALQTNVSSCEVHQLSDVKAIDFHLVVVFNEQKTMNSDFIVQFLRNDLLSVWNYSNY